MPKNGDLRVWWIPQVPSHNPFYVKVGSPGEAAFVLDILAKYDIYQLQENVKPDYSNAGGLEIYHEMDGWSEWYDETTGEDIDEWMEFLLGQDNKPPLVYQETGPIFLFPLG